MAADTSGGSAVNEHAQNMLTAALELAARGWPVFPANPAVGAKGKAPLVKDGFKAASCDPEQVRAYWGRFPNALIATVPGWAGLLTVDLDPGEGETPEDVLARLEAKLGCQLPATPRVRTQSGGWHLYFAKPDGLEIGNSKPLPDVDIRCDHGYVIVPPSRMANGNAYTWEVPFDGEPAAPPAQLVDLITKRTSPAAAQGSEPSQPAGSVKYSEDPGDQAVRRYARAALDRAAAEMAGTPKGGRGTALNAHAYAMGHYVAAGALSEREVLAALQDAADRSGLTGEDGPKERDAKIRRGLEAGAREPGDIPARLRRIADEARAKAERRTGPKGARADHLPGGRRDDAGLPPPEDGHGAVLPFPREGGPPGGAEEGVDHLTPAEWAILEECAGLDENDADNGKRLLRWFGDKVLHVNESGWFGWAGTHWDVETGQHAVERYAHKIVTMIKREAALIEATPDELALMADAARIEEEHPDPAKRSPDVKDKIKRAAAVAKALASRRHGRYQFGIRSGDRNRTRAMIEQAVPHRSVLPKVMDADDLALNTPSGTLRFARELDLDCPDPDATRYRVTRRLDPHNPADHISKVTAAAYDPAAKAPRFRRDLERFMPDEANREFLQVFAGYSALGVTGEQVYAFLYGDGSNWKSAFTQAIGRALGTYTKPMNYASVSGQNTPSGDKPSPDWARLPGVRMLTIEEIPKREPLREELIKMVTSGSDMPVRHLNKGLFDMRTTFTAWMISNGEPNILGADHGIWRRTLIVHWEVTIPEGERLPFDRVMAFYDSERSGILNWIIEGVEKYLANGLKPYITESMRAFTESVRRDRDAVGAFVEDCVEHFEGSFVTSRELYRRGFLRWCAANGVDPVPSETSFGMKVKRVPVDGIPMEKRKRNFGGVKRFADIRLHNLPAQEPSYDADA